MTKISSFLSISTNPFRPSKPSNLSLPSSPFSPKSPLSPPAISSETARGSSGMSSARSDHRDKTKKKKKNNSSNSNSRNSFSFLNNTSENQSHKHLNDVNSATFATSSSSSSSSPPCSPLSLPTSATLASSSSLSSSSPPTSPPPRPSRPSLPPPPERPLPWTWQCHICYRRYPLATTRRCLEDGHYFCSGMTEVKRTRRQAEAAAPKTKKFKWHRPCQSEFDYDGWKAWGEWRRGVEALTGDYDDNDDGNDDDDDDSSRVSSRTLASRRLALQLDVGDVGSVGGVNSGFDGIAPGKNCIGECDYPSECRWKRQMSVRMPEMGTPGFAVEGAGTGAATTAGAGAATSSERGSNGKMDVVISGTEMLLPTVFEEDGGGGGAGLSTTTTKTTTKTTAATTTAADEATVAKIASGLASWKDESKDDFWKSLLASVSRRKSVDVQDDSVDLSDLVTEPDDESNKDVTRSVSV